MPKQIYEYKLDLELVRSVWKVFDSEIEAMAYGRKEQEELNDGLSLNEKAVVGYCYILGYAQPIKNLVDSKINRLLKKSFFSQTRSWANKSKILSADLPGTDRSVFEKSIIINLNHLMA